VIIFAGSALLSAAPVSWDVVVASFSPSRGLDLSDVLGLITVFVGVVVLWTAPPRC
jgi:hypothetical protein